MLQLETTGQFRKDYKRLKKRGYDMCRMEQVIDKLLEENALPAQYHDHALSGTYAGFRECHVSRDWLFIYAVHRDKRILTASRTGSHSDLLRKG